MFQLFLFLYFAALLLQYLLPRYLLSIYKRYRRDSYWQEVRPYKKRYPTFWVTLLFMLLGLETTELQREQLFYLLLIAFLLSLSWLDLKLRILPDELLFLLALSGLIYHYFVLNCNISLQLATVMLCCVCVKIIYILCQRLGIDYLQQGFGGGDIKFILALLCWFNYQQVLYLLLLACLFALIVLIAQRIFSKKTVNSVAFGPFLSTAAYIIWWYG